MIVLSLVLALVALVVASVGIMLTYRISKRMPKMHFDEKDGYWVLDDCVRVDEIAVWGCGDVYINYDKKKGRSRI